MFNLFEISKRNTNAGGTITFHKFICSFNSQADFEDYFEDKIRNSGRNYLLTIK